MSTAKKLLHAWNGAHQPASALEKNGGNSLWERITNKGLSMPEKVTLGPRTLVYPMPSFLVGANVEDSANFMAVAWGGIACSRPPMVSVALQHHRYTYKGIKQTGTFSVNIPSQDQVTETDYCGIVSGSKADKNKICGFKVFYGKLEKAPMIEQCPVNLECKVVHVLDLGSHALIIGEVVETYINTDCLTGGEPDPTKIKPFIYTEGPVAQYQAFGEVLAPAFKVGRKLKSK
jgi:flavin reductase (DIM6/NTAB) family NADH-FMN oxidoreductase RutF